MPCHSCCAKGPKCACTHACTHTDSAAKLILRLTDDLLDGHMPDVCDVVVVRQAIRGAQDIYQPLDLSSQLEGAGMDVST
jgi:hypothetical protein